MKKQPPLVDFKELAGDAKGEALEKLVRLLGQRLGLSPVSSGRGADQGRDLTFTEVSTGAVSHKKTIWLVSCKDKAEGGKSVTEADLPKPGIPDKLRQHKADGFLLVTTTAVSTAAKALLDGLADSGTLIQVWDSAELTSKLLQEGNRDLLQQFLPQSYQRVKKTDSLEAALHQFSDQLPEHVLLKVLEMVGPYTSGRPKGAEIWPESPKIAKALDKIIDALIEKNDIETAASKSMTLEADAIMTLAYALHKKYPDECFKYLYELVQIAGWSKTDISYNAYQFLADSYTLTRQQILELAPYIDDADSLIHCQEAADFVLWSLTNPEGDYHIDDEIMRVGSSFNSFFVMGPELDEIIFYIAQEERIEFQGTFSFDVVFGHGAEATKKQHVTGEFSGFFNTFGIQLTERTMNFDDLPDLKPAAQSED